MKTALSILALLLAGIAVPSRAQDAGTQPDMDEAHAIDRVIRIVNQPIVHLARTSEAGVFSPGWFDAGAIKPDFTTVDIRATQEFPYDRFSYVTSDLNPNEMFTGKALEFNSMTKYFYIDRSLPKKRLSEREMLEINSLYRIIGRQQQAASTRLFLTLGGAILVICIGAGLILVARRAL